MLTDQASVTFTFEKSLQETTEFNEEYAKFMRKVRSMEAGTYTNDVIQPETKLVLDACFQAVNDTLRRVSNGNNKRTIGDVLQAVEFFTGMLRYIDGEIPEEKRVDFGFCTADSCCVQEGTTYTAISPTDTKKEIFEHFISMFGDALSSDSHDFDESEVEVIRETVDFFERALFSKEKVLEDGLELRYNSMNNSCDDSYDVSEGESYKVL